MSNLSQIAQVVVNLEHFSTACEELEGVLMGLRHVYPSFSHGYTAEPRHRASQRGGPVKLMSRQAFAKCLATAEGRIDATIGSKLGSFFELAEYVWLPARPQSTAAEPSTYVFEMITFLTAYVDSVLIGLNEAIKTRAYQSALSGINRWLMVSFRPHLSTCADQNAGYTMQQGGSTFQRGGTSEHHQ